MFKPSLMLSALLFASGGAQASELQDVNKIVQQANLAAYYAADDGRAEARMLIEDRDGGRQSRQFTILRRDRAEGGDQDFLVAFSRPADVRNTVFMVAKHVAADDDRWLYLPGLDLVKRISAGDKRTSFMGSHYFYEDVSGRNLNDDEHKLLSSEGRFYQVLNTPKDPATVEFSRYQVWIDKANMLPVKIEYQDETGSVYRRVEVLDISEVQGIPTVTRSRVSDLRSGGSTTMEFRFQKYNIGLDDAVFSERSLRKLPRQWLKRPAS
ncbi:outer membrane lipoprotein-sorting protein [Marinobacterium jannaschii]|uniref:outer membrane lipoprotein-sorting protein n=1 Tax=Marinobacterium jannaschii TaxID=64970 RepID=UPI000566846F|nr:outer membrane lipoprotein-sorting protein [Marinobacterium jannaschii]